MRLSASGLKVLRALLDAGRQPLAGSDLYKATRVGAGTLYPFLARLETEGWVTSQWEAIDPKAAGRPRKRFYELTCEGQIAARRELAAVVTGELAWAT